MIREKSYFASWVGKKLQNISLFAAVEGDSKKIAYTGYTEVKFK